MLSSFLWTEEATKYPEVVLDTIKDNPAMSSLLSVKSHPVPLWNLEWLQDYLESTWDTPAFPNVLPKVLFYLGEQLQHVATDSSIHWRALRTLFKVTSFTQRSTYGPKQIG